LTAGGTDRKTQLVEKFNPAMEILLDADKTLVIYVWPKKIDQRITVQPYSIQQGKKDSFKSGTPPLRVQCIYFRRKQVLHENILRAQ
jgi:hypothetical protein